MLAGGDNCHLKQLLVEDFAVTFTSPGKSCQGERWSLYFSYNEPPAKWNYPCQIASIGLDRLETSMEDLCGHFLDYIHWQALSANQNSLISPARNCLQYSDQSHAVNVCSPRLLLTFLPNHWPQLHTGLCRSHVHIRNKNEKIILLWIDHKRFYVTKSICPKMTDNLFPYFDCTTFECSV